jgi:hypothetical protein
MANAKGNTKAINNAKNYNTPNNRNGLDNIITIIIVKRLVPTV